MRIIFVAITAVLLAGCATKNYGRQGELTDFEKRTMTCREIALEEAKVMGFLDHVEKESEFDSRSVLSFLGDFGIGNLMEKDNAVKSANTRLRQLKEVSSERGCVRDADAPPPEVGAGSKPNGSAGTAPGAATQ